MRKRRRRRRSKGDQVTPPDLLPKEVTPPNLPLLTSSKECWKKWKASALCSATRTGGAEVKQLPLVVAVVACKRNHEHPHQAEVRRRPPVISCRTRTVCRLRARGGQRRRHGSV